MWCFKKIYLLCTSDLNLAFKIPEHVKLKPPFLNTCKHVSQIQMMWLVGSRIIPACVHLRRTQTGQGSLHMLRGSLPGAVEQHTCVIEEEAVNKTRQRKQDGKCSRESHGFEELMRKSSLCCVARLATSLLLAKFCLLIVWSLMQ